MNWKLFLEGAAAAAIGGAVNHAAMIPDGVASNPKAALKVIGTGAVIGLFAYLKNNARKPQPQPQTRLQADPPTDPGPQG